MMINKKKLFLTMIPNKIYESLGFFSKRTRRKHQINKEYDIRIFYLGDCVQGLPYVVIHCACGINYCFDVEVFDARKISSHLFCDEVAVCVSMADYKHRLFHGVHPRLLASSGVTTSETLAFARIS